MELVETYPEPKYTPKWLALHAFFALVAASILSLIVVSISEYASSMYDGGLISNLQKTHFQDACSYSFWLFIITLCSVAIMQIWRRREINYVQYGLIGASLCLSFSLCLAFTQFIHFIAAYIIAVAMTVGLITMFLYALLKSKKATAIASTIITAIYAFILVLSYIGQMALLVGSLLLFAVIAMAMFFTIKLRIENEELVLK